MSLRRLQSRKPRESSSAQDADSFQRLAIRARHPNDMSTKATTDARHFVIETDDAFLSVTEPNVGADCD